MKRKQYNGILFIGDPHIEGRNPDFRSDDYPNAILKKLRWCLNHCEKNSLLPVLLGDLFDKPRDNPTWIIGELIEMLKGKGIVSIYGNHDCADPVLNENDSLSLLIKSGCLRLVSADAPWRGEINGHPALLGGSSYREEIPTSVDVTRFQDTLFSEDLPFGIWISHHDVLIPTYEGGRFSPFEIANIDLLVNGHIHTRGEPITKGQTTWMTPGNISRRSRSEKCRTQEPAVLQLTLTDTDYETKYVTVPHEPFDDVFHEPAFDADQLDGASAFVAGLSELRRRKTSSGAGLKAFLEKNIEQFEPPVAKEIMVLADQVTDQPT